MASKKGAGTSRNGRDSNPKMLGCKVFHGQLIRSGGIIVRQRGTRFHPGSHVGLGKDFTIYAKADGVVQYEGPEGRRRVSVLPASVVLSAPSFARVRLTMAAAAGPIAGAAPTPTAATSAK